MDYTTAQELADKLSAIASVSSAGVVYFENSGDAHPAIDVDNPPEDAETYGVSFYAYDMLIPQEVIQVVSKYDCGGIITEPDIGVVAPKK